MDWQDILLSFLLSGVVGVILKSAVEAGFAREMSKVELANSTQLARLNSELQRIQTLETTKFSELHQRRAAAMLELYGLLVPAEERLEFAGIEVPRLAGYEDTGSASDRLQDSTRSLDDAIDPLVSFYKLNKILLSQPQEQLMDKIMAIFKRLRGSVFMRALSREFPLEDEEERTLWQARLQTDLSEAASQFRDVYPGLKKELEDEFRATLGFAIEEFLERPSTGGTLLSA